MKVLTLLLILLCIGCSSHPRALPPRVTFEEHVALDAYPEQRLFAVLRPFRFIVDGSTYEVPAGTLTDLASIPTWAQSFDQNDAPDILRPSVGHDWLYQNQGLGIYTRADCDGILRDGMQTCGAGYIRRQVVWAAVRAFGQRPWEEASKRRQKLSTLRKTLKP